MSKVVDELIHAHKVMVFSKTYCPYCVKAKNVLAKYKINDLKTQLAENISNIAREYVDDDEKYFPLSKPPFS